MTNMTDITVPVPRDRVADFYRDFAKWLEGPVAEGQGPETTGLDEATLLNNGVEWWRSLNKNERAMLSFWADEAPRAVPAKEIVEKLNLEEPREIPGIMSWTSRKGKKAGFPAHWTYDKDPDTKKPVYGFFREQKNGMSATEYAALIRTIRDTADAN